MKMMYTRTDMRNGQETGHTTTYLSGIVTGISIPDHQEDRKPAKVTVKTKSLVNNNGVKEWQDCSIQLTAWGENITRVAHMHLSEGSYVVFRCGDISEYETRNGGVVLQATYWGAMYTGYWEIADARYPELLMVAGFPLKDGILENPDGSATITIKARSFIDGDRQDVIFNLNVKAKAYNALKQAGFNQYCIISAVGVMVNDETMDVKVIDFNSRPRSEGNKSNNRGYRSNKNRGGSSRGSSRAWGGASAGFDE